MYLRVTTHLALLVQWFYGECVGSYVDDHAQLKPVCWVGRPYWLAVLHGLPPVNAAAQLRKRKRQKEENMKHVFGLKQICKAQNTFGIFTSNKLNLLVCCSYDIQHFLIDNIHNTDNERMEQPCQIC